MRGGGWRGLGESTSVCGIVALMKVPRAPPLCGAFSRHVRILKPPVLPGVSHRHYFYRERERERDIHTSLISISIRVELISTLVPMVTWSLGAFDVPLIPFSGLDSSSALSAVPVSALISTTMFSLSLASLVLPSKRCDTVTERDDLPTRVRVQEAWNLHFVLPRTSTWQLALLVQEVEHAAQDGHEEDDDDDDDDDHAAVIGCKKERKKTRVTLTTQTQRAQNRK